MKKNLLIIVFILSLNTAKSQWCVPNTALPYSIDMPGITRVVINTIDRTSSDMEDFPNNNYVNTGMSTSLMRGSTYNFQIIFTIDPAICLDMNLRVWIDYNQNYILNDAGETALSVDNRQPGTYNGSITIPANAPLGATRMRVTAKMTSNGGHTLPTPCDIPADPFGYHGEIEDYEVVITSPVGIDEVNTNNNFNVVQSDEQLQFTFTQKEKSVASIILSDIKGRIVEEVLSSQLLDAGDYQFELKNGKGKLNSGIYFGTLIVNGKRSTTKIAIE